MEDMTNTSVPGTMARVVEQMHWPHSAGIGASRQLVLAAWAGVVLCFYRRYRGSTAELARCRRACRRTISLAVGVEWSLLATVPLAFTPDSEQIFAIMPVTLLAAMLALPGKFARSPNSRRGVWR